MKGMIRKMSIAGAACYSIWGCLHIYAGYGVFMLGDSVDPGMCADACIKAAGIFFFRSRRHSRCPNVEHSQQQVGLLDQSGLLALADTGLIFFVLIPGYWSWWPGLAGPILWVAGFILTTLAYIRDVPPGESRP